MSVQMFSDHSDFYKARRALIASAVTLILLQDIELVKNTLTIFSLEFIISFEKISFYLMLVTLYFSYVFLLRSRGQRREVYGRAHSVLIQEEIDLLTALLEQISRPNLGEKQNTLLHEVELHMHHLRELRESGFHKRQQDWFAFVAIEIVPTWLIALFSVALYFSVSIA